jgi:hypothetical protein
VSVVALTNVVLRDNPFQRTPAPLTKPEPVIVTVTDALPVLAEDGFSDVIAGAAEAAATLKVTGTEDGVQELGETQLIVSIPWYVLAARPAGFADTVIVVPPGVAVPVAGAAASQVDVLDAAIWKLRLPEGADNVNVAMQPVPHWDCVCPAVADKAFDRVPVLREGAAVTVRFTDSVTGRHGEPPWHCSCTDPVRFPGVRFVPVMNSDSVLGLGTEACNHVLPETTVDIT